MTEQREVAQHPAVVGGVDTHGDTHHAAVLDEVGRRLADRAFPTTPAGYRQLLAWLRSFGRLERVGVEGTGAYGAALARMLRQAGVTVVEVDRPDRKARRLKGKSDPVDAYSAAWAALSGRSTGTPKSRNGRIEAIRTLRVTRRGAVKARTQAINQLRALLLTGPAELREQLRGLPKTALVSACARLRPTADLADPSQATKAALRRLARRHQHLTAEIAELDAELATLVTAAAPELLTLPGVGVETAGQLLTTAGDNPERLHSDAAFAHLCGAAPIPASSGRTDRHRLNRGGDRWANCALHTIALSRMRWHEPTRAYAARRRQQGLSNKEIMRCLKRLIARQIYYVIRRLEITKTAPATA
ncbi:IS110 family transposase [Micromonospora sp. IBHARD004]|uniref:IS110 family transposase n=1 Tax=Micromonospora sp. IBHARD004 TaxID=3457764 RepID=UPI004058482C